MFKVLIPEITEVELERRYKQIKPVVTVNGKLHYMREFTLEELRGQSYLWSKDSDVREEVPKGELEVMEGKDFSCLHSWGYYGVFIPSIAEVLAQIGDMELDFVSAFEIIEWPKTAEDFYKDSITKSIFDDGYHISTVRLYMKVTHQQ